MRRKALLPIDSAPPPVVAAQLEELPARGDERLADRQPPSSHKSSCLPPVCPPTPTILSLSLSDGCTSAFSM